MRCPYCGYEGGTVLDSRPIGDGYSIRRRRMCPKCEARFTTFERIELMPVVVIKRGGRREAFNREKIVQSISRVCHKRDISRDAILSLVDEIDNNLQNSATREVASSKIRDYIITKLRDLDEVAYIRYSSTYLGGAEVASFAAQMARYLDRRPKDKEPVFPPKNPKW